MHSSLRFFSQNKSYCLLLILVSIRMICIHANFSYASRRVLSNFWKEEKKIKMKICQHYCVSFYKYINHDHQLITYVQKKNMLDNNKLAINFQHLLVDIYRNLHIL